MSWSAVITGIFREFGSNVQSKKIGFDESKCIYIVSYSFVQICYCMLMRPFKALQAAVGRRAVMDDGTPEFLFCAAVIEYLSMCKRDIFPIF